MNGPVYFVSDTHFKYHDIDESENRKKERFFKFLSDIEGAARLYLAGDIFDFWFEYRHVVPGSYWDILYRLQLLRESGTDIYITGGNHDFWLGSFISDVMKFHILPQFSIQNLQGRRIAVTHGDMMLPGDLGYKLLKKTIRNRAVIKIAKMVHPGLLFAFARRFSCTSKDFTSRKTDYWAGRVTDLARDNFFEWDNDTFIMGHIHKPVLRRFGEKVFCILGDWEENCSYLRLEEGKFSAGSYNEDGNTFMEKR
ncbi:MAG: UDP-2,3-diacylglucosamine diphosphatase [Candidatus Krumholzibacteriota bacterium]